MRTVAVFGSSEPLPGDPAYEQARRVGALLAGAGHDVITGGYGGVMEGANRGAHEAGGWTIGVVCDIFSDRQPNPYLRESVPSPDLHERTRVLVERATAYVVLPGRAGTLAELALLWALDRAGCLGRRPVVLLGAGYRSLVDLLARQEMLSDPQLRITRIVDTPEQVLAALEQTEPEP